MVREDKGRGCINLKNTMCAENHAMPVDRIIENNMEEGGSKKKKANGTSCFNGHDLRDASYQSIALYPHPV